MADAEPGATPIDKVAPTRTKRQPWDVVKKRWRGWLRAVHRDVGYCLVGLTVVYAISGLAINHIQDWDANFITYERELHIAPIGADVPDAEAVRRVRAALSLDEPRTVYRAGDELHLELDERQVVVYGDSGLVIDQGRKARFFLRVANWLHYNRGKAAWTYIADAYAGLLLYLAISGIFMIKGKLGLRWRGAVLVTLGAAVPIAYVVLSGGPGAHRGDRDASGPSAPGEIAPASTEPSAGAAPMEPPEPPPERPPVRRAPPPEVARPAP